MIIYTIKRMPEFEVWLSGIKDGMIRIRLARRIDKLQRGLLGDVAPVGEGVSELREFFGPRHCIEQNTVGVTDHDHKNKNY
jgi:putative addiction module killer protein